MERLNMDRAAPILIRIYKEESTLEIWKQDRTGQYALLKSYPICNYSGHLGPKIFEGDHQAPEGFYDIAPNQMNPWSHEYLAFNIGFPNSFDRSLGRTGRFLMVHGGCESVGCYAMTDYEMEEVYGLVDEALKGGQAEIQLEAFPFRMTMQNMMRHANDPNVPFWDMLKDGSDAFFLARRPPRVAVCDHRYVFNPILVDNDLDANAPCPPGIDSRVADAQSQSAASAGDGSKPVASEEPITRETESVFSPQRIQAILDEGYKPRSETQY
jgi:murein L,D-transpeptidase YafK